MKFGIARRAAMIALLTLAPGQALAAVATAEAAVAVVQPLSLVKTQDLEFGALLVGATGGSVTIDPNNDARSATGGVTLAGSAGGAAEFVTYGGPRQYIWITRGPLPVLIRQGGGGSMNVSQLTLDGATFRYLNSSGLLDLRVGGTLQVSANQPAGYYEGVFEITVTYF